MADSIATTMRMTQLAPHGSKRADTTFCDSGTATCSHKPKRCSRRFSRRSAPDAPPYPPRQGGGGDLLTRLEPRSARLRLEVRVFRGQEREHFLRLGDALELVAAHGKRG